MKIMLILCKIPILKLCLNVYFVIKNKCNNNTGHIWNMWFSCSTRSKCINIIFIQPYVGNNDLNDWTNIWASWATSRGRHHLYGGFWYIFHKNIAKFAMFLWNIYLKSTLMYKYLRMHLLEMLSLSTTAKHACLDWSQRVPDIINLEIAVKHIGIRGPYYLSTKMKYISFGHHMFLSGNLTIEMYGYSPNLTCGLVISHIAVFYNTMQSRNKAGNTVRVNAAT